MSASRPLGILLVDDEPDLREALAQMLVFLGHTVICADDGESAVSLYGEGKNTDLLISDLSMPGMGGAGLVGALRSKRRDLPVIVFSGLDETVARGLIKNLTNIFFLRKPFTFQTLADTIQEASRR